ncbi:hypothetical protein [Sphingomonas sp. GC_Shp_1]|uniref:hypothetical protein n=1 Tax=unclassified Sphingomonas TaxID=196159 RepID=UPI0031F8729E
MTHMLGQQHDHADSDTGVPQTPETDPGVAAAESGEVLLDGPDGVAVSMTPESADETGRRLIVAAKEADKQR